jgi:biotin operon repressor
MCHLYCFIRKIKVGHTEYFWKLLKAIGGVPTLHYQTALEVFGKERCEQRLKQIKTEGVMKMAKEQKEKKIPGTVRLATMLENGSYSVDELAEACGLSVNTIKVQLSFHLKQKGYQIACNEGKYQITGKGPALPPRPKKAKKVEAPEEQ